MKLSLSRAIDTMENGSWCPTPGCDFGFVKENQSEFFCPKCYFAYCLDCRVDMHYGLTCIQFKADKVNQANDDDVIRVLKDVI